MALHWEVSITEDFFTSFEAFQSRYLPTSASALKNAAELKKFENEALALDSLITQVGALEIDARAGNFNPKTLLAGNRPGIYEIQAEPFRTILSLDEPNKVTVWSVIKDDEVS